MEHIEENHGGVPTTTKRWTKGGPVETAVLAPAAIAELQERQETTMGEPAAMALFGFAVGTFIIAWPISGFVPDTALPATIAPVLIFAGIAQFIGGLIAFRRDDAFAGTAFCAYGANNVVVATFFLLQTTGALSSLPGSPQVRMLALELYCFAYISLALGVAAMRLNVTFVAILLALVPGFTLAGMSNWYGAAISVVWGHIGGYCLMASAVFAAYTATVMVLNSTWQRAVLPLGTLGGGLTNASSSGVGGTA